MADVLKDSLSRGLWQGDNEFRKISFLRIDRYLSMMDFYDDIMGDGKSQTGAADAGWAGCKKWIEYFVENISGDASTIVAN